MNTKTDWHPSDLITDADLNRIESNILRNQNTFSMTGYGNQFASGSAGGNIIQIPLVVPVGRRLVARSLWYSSSINEAFYVTTMTLRFIYGNGTSIQPERDYSVTGTRADPVLISEVICVPTQTVSWTWLSLDVAFTGTINMTKTIGVWGFSWVVEDV